MAIKGKPISSTPPTRVGPPRTPPVPQPPRTVPNDEYPGPIKGTPPNPRVPPEPPVPPVSTDPNGGTEIIFPYTPPVPDEPQLPPTMVDKWSDAVLVVTHGKGMYHSVLKVNGQIVFDKLLPFTDMTQSWVNSFTGTMRFGANPIDEEPKP